MFVATKKKRNYDNRSPTRDRIVHSNLKRLQNSRMIPNWKALGFFLHHNIFWQLSDTMRLAVQSHTLILTNERPEVQLTFSRYRIKGQSSCGRCWRKQVTLSRSNDGCWNISWVGSEMWSINNGVRFMIYCVRVLLKDTAYWLQLRMEPIEGSNDRRYDTPMTLSVV
jgi:hypothetical protein